MTIDHENLARQRRMRGYVSAALDIAETVGDTLTAALLDDLEHRLSARIGAIVSATGDVVTERPPRFSLATGYGRKM